ncbi:MAG: glycosyltransferase [Planctomycetota bacterium]
MHIGLQAIGGSGWMGGANYINNLVKALDFLPAEQRPMISLLLPNAGDVTPFQEITSKVKLLPCPFKASRHVLGCGESSLTKELGKRLLGRTRLWAALRRHLQLKSFAQLEPVLRRQQIEVVFPMLFSLGRRFGLPWIGWVPDLQYKYFPELFGSALIRDIERCNQALADESPLLVVSSRNAAADMERSFPTCRPRLRVLSFTTVPPVEWFAGDPRRVADDFGLPADYLIIPNQFMLHKNHALAFKALRILHDRGVRAHLACTGKSTDTRSRTHFEQLRALAKELRVADKITFVGLIPRFQQVQLLRAARAILQPSLFEGWSTVVEDARALGKPLFLSDLAIHREQAPPLTTYFDPHNPEALADQIQRRWDELRAAPLSVGGLSTMQRAQITEYALVFMRLCEEVCVRKSAAHD